ncbi:uncharacterized protein LOC117177839 isoform X1 [Belonocnema kinseyi]|uniref:uncharacterized protein LOC117177839 isoform X1 n=1 Tax=Belonocnema kinseyi TaxID=2817044 RepID=UPI00143CE664|nr:uncharacterized protein LOC117177839 isoform X1 [Belonocnema kinseyi]
METETEPIQNKQTNSSSDEASQYDESTAFLGNHPDKDKIEEADFIEEVADRIKVWLKEGISRDEISQIIKLVPRKYKDCYMDAPKLNAEIQTNLREVAIKRDRYFFNYQHMIGSSLSLTATALSMILNDKIEPINRDVLLQHLSDAVKINADLFHSWKIARKVYITPAFDKKSQSRFG